MAKSMNFLSVDWDSFMANPSQTTTSEGNPWLWDWGHREAPFFAGEIWNHRAASFLSHDVMLPITTGDELTFWDRSISP
jgi:hypothetical protein